MADISTYLDELNEPQREAVLENSHPLLVLAGAGSGKTRVITTKIAYAIEHLGIPPYQILAVTFTNKAAHEMRERVTQMLDDRPDSSETVIRTFHSFGAWLLRRFGSEIGLEPTFSIYDDEDSLSLLASCYPERKKVDLAPVMKAISGAKDRGLSWRDNLKPLRMGDSFSTMFRRYEEKLAQVGNVDFADLIGLSIRLLTESASVRSWIHRRFAMILVDEYQDTNRAQLELLKLLVGPNTFVCVVGDDDQSIYRFRGAEVANILSFSSHFAGTRMIKLEQNYRSTNAILEVANSVISNNTGRHDKHLWTDRSDDRLPTLHYVQDEQDEVSRIATLLRSDRNYDGSAILYRTNAQSQAFEMGFKRLGIPHKVVGSLQFFEREEVKDGLALLYMMTNPRDEVSFRRIINKPTRGIGPAAVERILSYASSTQGDLVAALQRAAEEGELSSRAQEGALHLSSLFARVRPMIETNDLVVAVTLLLEETGLLAYYQEQDRKAATFRVDNLQQLVNVIGEYEQSGEGLLLFLEQMALDRTTLGDADPSQEDGVTLITMHNTKGLEFDRVFIVGLEEEIFPGRNGSDKDDIEEERRTFYVALTRAKNELHLFSARRRRMWGHSSIQKPSRFLSEIEPSLIEMVGSPYDVESPQWSTPGWDKPKRSSWAVGGGNLIQQGFGPKAKTFTMKRVHEAEEGKPLFEVGQRVYNTNYGEGEVVSSRTGRDGQQVIDVHFFSGQKATYIAKFADIEKIGDV